MKLQKSPGDVQTAYISVGSNLGRRRDNCCAGIRLLAETRGCRLTARAPCYRTAPVDYVDQGWFVNTVIRIETSLSPERLLSRLKAIETEVGRKPGPIRYGPRVLDMDILLFGDRIIDHSGLAVPHPRMHERRFVLIPFCDIEPSAVHPVLGKTMQALLDGVNETNQEVEPYPCDC